MSSPLVEIKNLKTYFSIGKQKILKAVDDVSLTIPPGETLGLVGESGCGKSTLGRTLLNLEKATSGEIVFDGKNVQQFSPKELKNFRHEAQMIFQDPYSSLNPRMMAGDIIGEPLKIHQVGTKKEQREKVDHLLEIVGLGPSAFHRYPHEFSGGQRQRIGIARSLALTPRFIVCDEPIAALDVSIQAQIINLLKKLQQEMNLTYLFIAHDLAMVKYLSTRVAVMYLGQIMEEAPSETLYHTPLHPYTQALLSAIPIPDPQIERSRQRIILTGDIPSPINPPQGCVFSTRCPHATDICRQSRPQKKEIAPGHFASCHLL
jgi:oligopeptide/dipeptide ABC transporter ATP-binding protein